MIRIASLALLACTACTTTTAPDASMETGARCDATPIQSLVGQSANDATIADAKTRSGARDVRRYTSGSALTMDFRADRLNVETDESGRIVKLVCG